MIDTAKHALASLGLYAIMGLLYLLVFGFPVLAICAFIYHLVLPLFGGGGYPYGVPAD